MRNFEHVSSAMPEITKRYVSKSLCGKLAKKNLEILKDDNSTLEIENNDFEHNPKLDNITTVNPKIIQKYTNYHPSDYLVDKIETDFENLKVKNSKT